MIMGDVSPTPKGGWEAGGGVGNVGDPASTRGRFPVSAGSGNSVLLKFLISFSGRISAKKKKHEVEMSVY
jgi:hypothetical protein